MFEIKLNEELVDFSKNKIVERYEMAGNSKIPIYLTFKDVYLNYLGLYNSNEGKKVIKSYKIGLAIADSKAKTFKLEKDEFGILKESINSPQSMYSGIVKGQVLVYFDGVTETKEELNQKK